MKSRPYLLFTAHGKFVDFIGDYETMQQAMIYLEGIKHLGVDTATIVGNNETWKWSKESDIWLNETKA